jgi:hypothetical protein
MEVNVNRNGKCGSWVHCGDCLKPWVRNGINYWYEIEFEGGKSVCEFGCCIQEAVEKACIVFFLYWEGKSDKIKVRARLKESGNEWTYMIVSKFMTTAYDICLCEEHL